MKTQEAILTRQSIRSYQETQICEEELNIILEAAHAAPVAGGKYTAMQLTVVQDSNLLKRVSNAIKSAMNFPADPLYKAPTLLIVSGTQALDKEALYANAGCILENIQIAATDLGLGSCIIWGAGFAIGAKKELLEDLKIAEGFIPLVGVVIGHSTHELVKRKIKENYRITFLR